MSFFNVPVSYNALLGEQDIASTMLPSTASKLVPCASVLKAVPTSSGSIGPSSSAMFQIQTGSGVGYLKAHSVYLRFRLDVTQTGAANTSWAFKGPAGLHNASALINRLTVSAGSTQLSQLTNYNIWHDLLLTHATSRDYTGADAVQYEYTGIVKDNSADNAINKTIYVSIPLLSPLFTSAQSLPLFLMQSPLTVEILFNSVASAFKWAAAGNAVTNYLISNAEIVYESIEVSPELKSSIMSRMANGGVWRQYLDSVYSLQTASQSTLSYNIGAGLSSLKGFLMSEIRATDLSTTANDANFVSNGFSNLRVYYDGKLINMFDLNNASTCFAELNRTLNAIYDSDRTSTLTISNPSNANQNYTDFVNAKWAVGVSSQAVSDLSIGFSGQPAQMVNFIIEHNSGAEAAGSVTPFPNNTVFAAGTIYAFLLYDELLTIDANGVVALLR